MNYYSNNSIPGYTLMMILLLCFSACKTSKDVVEEDGLDFEKIIPFTTTLDQAAVENKLIFVDFYTDWCLPCKMMEEEVFSDKAISDYFNENFINIKIDAEKGEGPDLSVIYAVQGFPTLLIVDSKGRVISRKEGLTYHRELQMFAEHAISLWENQ